MLRRSGLWIWWASRLVVCGRVDGCYLVLGVERNVDVGWRDVDGDVAVGGWVYVVERVVGGNDVLKGRFVLKWDCYVLKAGRENDLVAACPTGK